MHHTALAGLPRLVRVTEEVRLRGQGAVAIGCSALAYWLLAWLLDDSVEVRRTLVNLGAAVVLAALIAAIVSGRRVREGVAHLMPPPRTSRHETAAVGRVRRLRLAALMTLVVVAVLVFDRATDGEGGATGIVAGLFLAVGAVDWWEARRWRAIERSRGCLLYVLVRSQALMSPYGVTEVFEVSAHEDIRPREPVESDYTL